jgi:poly-gamma-glutamate capsule biosynthesis protein CapA/YwtB (metallophosphatase superfamily)
MYSLIQITRHSERRAREYAGCILLLSLLWLAGCQTTPPSPEPSSAPTRMATAVAQPPIATASQTPTPAPTAAATPTLTPTITPTPTALPLVQLIVPEQWAVAAATAVNQLLTEGSAWRWEVVVGSGDPEPDQVTTGTVRLTTTTGDHLVAERPLALAIPFITAWERTSLAEAQTILAQGHNLVQVIDYDDLTPNYKALRVDGRFPHDDGYPLQERWYISGDQAAAAAIAPWLSQLLAPEPLIQLTAVGDIMLNRSLGYNLVRGDRLYPFTGVVAALQAADITVGNLECALGDIGEPAPKAYPFRAPPEAAESLALAGFDILSLANNHAMDYGPEALLQGIGLLEAQNIATIGAGANSQAARAPHIMTVHGIRLAFLGYVNVPVEWRGFDTRVWEATAGSPGLAWGDPEIIAADVAAIRPDVDLVIVILHSGYEYIAEPSPDQVAAARAAVAAGADLVIGHHAHILQGIEFYQGKVIAYGLGNFAFDIDGDPETALLNVWLDRQGVRQIEIVPAIVRFGGQPRLAHEWEAPAIRQQVYNLTRALNPR